jgi:cytochrome c1
MGGMVPRPGAVLRVLAVACVVAAAHAADAQDLDALARGRELLVQYRCGTCHAIPGVPGAHGQVAQALTAWGLRSYIAGRLPNRPEVLARWIAAPDSLVPGTLMPRMGASAAEAQAMALYLSALR